ncbi:MAG: FkbM family methyltransferase [Candidatus Lokiarchaeota archaeon]|nr:FkbM family methyltransferase [Candidatus Lokiarchaeota archaeon]
MLLKNIVIEKEHRKLERKLTKEFFRKRDFSKFEKDTIKLLKVQHFSAKTAYHRDFYNELKANEDTLNEIIEKLNEQSRNAVKKFINRLKYVSTHLYIDLIVDLFKNEEKLMKHLEKVNSYRDLKLHENLYEESVFGYHHGLVYLPKDRLRTIANKDFLDCGAFVGDSALIFEKFYNPKKIYSFEPDEESYDYIFNTIKINKLKKVVPIKLGVGAKEGEVNFTHMSCASHVTQEKADTRIKLTTIDKFVFDNDLDVGVIKLDLEGYAYEALQGAVRTIEKFRPVLLICVYHNAKEFVDGTKFVQDLDLDYNIKIKHLGGLIPATETHLIAW